MKTIATNKMFIQVLEMLHDSQADETAIGTALAVAENIEGMLEAKVSGISIMVSNTYGKRRYKVYEGSIELEMVIPIGNTLHLFQPEEVCWTYMITDGSIIIGRSLPDSDNKDTPYAILYRDRVVWL